MTALTHARQQRVYRKKWLATVNTALNRHTHILEDQTYSLKIDLNLLPKVVKLGHDQRPLYEYPGVIHEYTKISPLTHTYTQITPSTFSP